MKTTNKEQFYKAIGRRGYWSWLTAESDDHTVSVHSRDDDYHFADLMDEEKEKALAWIRANVFPRKTPLERYTSYGMKHVLVRRTNIYMTNNQFKEAMLLFGFYPVRVDELNWHYCVSKRSPIFQYQPDGFSGLLLPECVMEYKSDQSE